MLTLSDAPSPSGLKNFRPAVWRAIKITANTFTARWRPAYRKIGFRYRLKPLNTSDFAVTEGRVDIVDQKAFLTIEAQPNHAGRIVDFTGMVVSGVFSDVKPNDQVPTLVRLLSRYGSNIIRDAQVDATGHFALREIREPGNYVVLVCRDGEVLAWHPVQVRYEVPEIKIRISR